MKWGNNETGNREGGKNGETVRGKDVVLVKNDNSR